MSITSNTFDEVLSSKQLIHRIAGYSSYNRNNVPCTISQNGQSLRASPAIFQNTFPIAVGSVRFQAFLGQTQTRTRIMKVGARRSYQRSYAMISGVVLAPLRCGLETLHAIICY